MSICSSISTVWNAILNFLCGIFGKKPKKNIFKIVETEQSETEMLVHRLKFETTHDVSSWQEGGFLKIVSPIGDLDEIYCDIKVNHDPIVDGDSKCFYMWIRIRIDPKCSKDSKFSLVVTKKIGSEKELKIKSDVFFLKKRDKYVVQNIKHKRIENNWAVYSFMFGFEPLSQALLFINENNECEPGARYSYNSTETKSGLIILESRIDLSIVREKKYKNAVYLLNKVSDLCMDYYKTESFQDYIPQIQTSEESKNVDVEVLEYDKNMFQLKVGDLKFLPQKMIVDYAISIGENDEKRRNMKLLDKKCISEVKKGVFDVKTCFDVINLFDKENFLNSNVVLTFKSNMKEVASTKKIKFSEIKDVSKLFENGKIIKYVIVENDLYLTVRDYGIQNPSISVKTEMDGHVYDFKTITQFPLFENKFNKNFCHFLVKTGMDFPLFLSSKPQISLVDDKGVVYDTLNLLNYVLKHETYLHCTNDTTRVVVAPGSDKKSLKLVYYSYSEFVYPLVYNIDTSNDITEANKEDYSMVLEDLKFKNSLFLFAFSISFAGEKCPKEFLIKYVEPSGFFRNVYYHAYE